MNDQKLKEGGKSYSIYPTDEPFDSPTDRANEIEFKNYISNGFSVLQNLAANIVLKLETNDGGAQI